MRINNFITAEIRSRAATDKGMNKDLNASIAEIVARKKNDTLTISRQRLFEIKLRNLDKTDNIQTNDDQFLKQVTNIVSSTLSHLKAKIEDTLDDYSSSKNKIETGGLDEPILEDQSLGQLQDKIRELISKAAKSLDELYKNTKTNSKAVSGKLEEIKEITSGFFNGELEHDYFQNESDFMTGIKKTLNNIDKTIEKVNHYF